MGAIIDLEKVEIIYRCNHVKRGIVWINLIGPPISLLFLTFGITRMFLVKKRKSLLTNIIILIFFSEIIQCLSKLIQLLKYTFPICIYSTQLIIKHVYIYSQGLNCIFTQFDISMP